MLIQIAVWFNATIAGCDVYIIWKGSVFAFSCISIRGWDVLEHYVQQPSELAIHCSKYLRIKWWFCHPVYTGSISYFLQLFSSSCVEYSTRSLLTNISAKIFELTLLSVRWKKVVPLNTLTSVHVFDCVFWFRCHINYYCIERHRLRRSI